MDVNGDQHSNRRYFHLLSSGIIFAVGFLLHWKGFSAVEFQFITTPKLAPNVASLLFVSSALLVLLVLRCWCHKMLTRPPGLWLFCVELVLATYICELLFRQLWLGLQWTLHSVCQFLSGFPHMQWMRREGYVFARFLMSLAIFCYTVRVITRTRSKQLAPTTIASSRRLHRINPVLRISQTGGDMYDRPGFPLDLPLHRVSAPRVFILSELPRAPGSRNVIVRNVRRAR